jgi:hypothetical protein
MSSKIGQSFSLIVWKSIEENSLPIMMMAEFQELMLPLIGIQCSVYSVSWHGSWTVPFILTEATQAWVDLK